MHGTCGSCRHHAARTANHGLCTAVGFSHHGRDYATVTVTGPGAWVETDVATAALYTTRDFGCALYQQEPPAAAAGQAGLPLD